MSLFILILLGVPIYLFVRNRSLGKRLRDLITRMDQLEIRVRALHIKISKDVPEAWRQMPPDLGPASEAVPQAKTPEPTVAVPPPTPVQPPQPFVPPAYREAPKPIVFDMEGPKPSKPAIDWEKFMGVKLFAWLGGFALFLGMAFFVKYSIDHNLISPAMRVIIGFLTGIGVIIGGLLLRNKGYAVTVQTLCAAGISILYADVFACRSVYDFLSTEAAFPLMILITVASFFLAVRLDSKYVAILGLIGGFLTPPLLSTGVDRPYALFSYIALLDIGVMAVAFKKRWGFLVGMSMASTWIMELVWVSKFFTAAKAELALGIYLSFCALYAAAQEVAHRRKEQGPAFHWPAGILPLLSMIFVANMLSYHALALRPEVVLTLLLLLSAQSAYMAVRRREQQPLYLLGSLITFLFLMYWTTAYLKSNMLMWGLGYYMAFAVVHSGLPIVLQRLRPSDRPFLWGYLAPILMLALIFFAMIFLDILSFVVWPFVLLFGMLAVAFAWLAGSIVAAGVTLVLIMGSFGVWLMRLPDVGGLPGILTLLAFFACAFFAWGLVVLRKPSLFSGNTKFSRAGGISPERAAQLPAFSALMPFMLLAMVCVKLSLANPSDVFGLMLLMVILLLGLVRYRAVDLIALIALASTAIVESMWHSHSYLKAEQMPIALTWYFVFYAIFTLFPFMCRKHLKGTEAWVAAAVAGPIHFLLSYLVISHAMGKAYIGLVPAFFAVPALSALVFLQKAVSKTDPQRNTLLALWGGVALFFITLIIPLQFDNEWITVGWALEGAALLWLFQRVPHEGLKVWGIGLLLISFVRLALNPAVFSYHPRTPVPFLNWYLFVYGVAAVCLFVSAYLLRPPKHLFIEWNMPAVFNALGTILTFLLMNIEIADFFSAGTTITFQFSGNLGQDMTYSLAWAVFGIVLLGIGIRQRAQKVRYASLGLLTVTIVKVFLHDLWRLGQLYRVASIIGLAIILILVSFLYQKYLAEKKGEVPA